MRKSLQWTEKEDELILQNISLITSKKWKIISNILKEQGFTKKQTQCRERYINHLAFSLDKSSQISTADLAIFYQKYEEFGPRWTQIQQFLPKKSQVQLKNIFYGNIRCFIKKIIKYFTNKTAVFVNKFDTFTLQNIYSAKKNYKGLTFLKDDIKKMSYRFDQRQCLSLIRAQEEKYKVLYNVLLDEEETKKSKNYHSFKKVELQDLRVQIDNATKLKKSQNQFIVTQLQKEQQHFHFEVNHFQSAYQKNNLSFQWSNPQNYWNELQYFYANEPSLIKSQVMNFYYPGGSQLFFQNYLTFLTYINNLSSQKISISSTS